MITTSVGEIKFNFTKLKKKKKTAHAYFWAPYFSKSFGGKIHHNWTDVTYRIMKQKNWRMRILGARIFLSFLAGKFWIFKQPIINSFPQSNKIAIAYIRVRVLETGNFNSPDPREKGSTSVLYLWINPFAIILVCLIVVCLIVAWWSEIFAAQSERK